MALKRGDLVACYITNTDQWEELLNWGIVLDVNESVHDILVLDNAGYQRWWPSTRWRLLKEEKSKKNIEFNLDTEIKLG